MSSPSKPIAVLGATGAQGRPVVHLLLAAGRPVRAIGRDPGRLAAVQAAGADARAADLGDSSALGEALAGVGGVVAHLPFVPVEALQRAWAQNLAAGLLAAEVPLTVFTTSGPVADAETGVATIDAKRAALTALRESGAPLVVLQPAIYLGNVAAPFSAPSVVDRGELRYPPFGAGLAMPYVSVEDQAALALAALARPDLIGATLPIGAQLTGDDLARGLGEALGRPVRHVPFTPDELGDAVRPLLGDEAAAALSADYTALATRPQGWGLDADTDAAHRELGVPPTPVAVWAREQDWEGAAALARTIA